MAKASAKGRPRQVRPIDLKVLTGPELRNIVALMPDLYSPREAYAMQPGELAKAIIADGGDTFKRINLTALNDEVFRDKSVIAYVIGLQDYVNNKADARPIPPQAAADLSEDALTAPAALEAYRAKVKAAEAEERAPKPAAVADAVPVPVVVPKVVKAKAAKPVADVEASPLELMEAALADCARLVQEAQAELAKFRALVAVHLPPE